MASDYGLNFGFRRSDESMATREGRFKTPATGTPLLLGTAVRLDAAAEGRLKVCPANEAPLSGVHGLLVQEESHLGSIFTASPHLGHDSLDLGTAKLDQLSTMWAGVGTKVWFKNTAVYNRGTRSKAAVTMVTLTAVALGDQLGWDGTKWVKADGATVKPWLSVTNIVSAAGYCEAVVQF